MTRGDMTNEDILMTYEPVFGSWEDYERHQKAKLIRYALRGSHVAAVPVKKLVKGEDGLYHDGGIEFKTFSELKELGLDYKNMI